MKKLLILTTLFLTKIGGLNADIPSTHGMLLFGQQVHYASHLPMFHAPHDYQLLLELEVEAMPGSQALIDYAALKNQGHKLFTLVPEVMDLSQVIEGNKTSFQALIFKDHFERGGENLGAVQVTVAKILFSDTLDPEKASTHKEDYFVFGQNGEYYAAHIIGGAPNFDAILSVESPYYMSVMHCRHRVCDDPSQILLQDNELPVVLSHNKSQNQNVSEYELPSVGTPLGFFFGPMTEVTEILYLEEGELSH